MTLRHRMLSSRHLGPLLVVLGVVVTGNLLYLSHFSDPNPLNLYSGLAAITHPGVIPGLPSADPNSGITAQALGHLAMSDWLHGHVPWWNQFEGLGAPLAGEMQAAALFPPTILLIFSNGQIYFHLLLEMVAGCSTYLLLSQLKVGRAVAVGGACAFALCGTFAWFSHAPANPIAFLPVILLGVEYASAERGGLDRRAWMTIALGLALSLYAGFPEVAYIDGVLASLWAVARVLELPAHRRMRAGLVVGTGVGVGVLLAAPILMAFVDYLPAANTGGHQGLFGTVSLPAQSTPQLFLPYVFGPIDAFSAADRTGELGAIWGSVGGFLTASLLMLGTLGLVGRRHRILRGTLALWLLLALGRTFGFPPFRFIINLLPGMKDVAFYRYSAPTWSMALIVLAAFGLDDLLHQRLSRTWVAAAAGFSVLVVAGSAAEARGILDQIASAAHRTTWAVGSVVWALTVVVVITGAALFLRGRWRGRTIVAVVVLDALAMFVVPQLSAPRSVAIYPAPATYLADHLGTSRFFTLGPIAANYGSYFGVAELNSNDLPEPTHYDAYLSDRLGLTPGSGPALPVAAADFVSHLKAFEASGVKFVLTPSGYVLPPVPGGTQLKEVFSGPSADIYQLPAPGGLYAVHKGSCRVITQGVSSVSLDCTSAQSLTRRELFMPGWTASVNGVPVRVTASGVFQQVHVGQGRSVVSFSFTPPHMGLALLGFLLGLVLLGWGGVGGVRARARPVAHFVGAEGFEPSLEAV
jgi:hypothetical protein